MDWKEIDIIQENPDKDPFVSIGNGQINVSRGACNLIKDFNTSNFVTFLRAKKDRILFIGLRFDAEESNKTIRFEKINEGQYGAVIRAKDLIETLFGNEGKNIEFTKHLIDVDPSHPNAIVIYHQYRKRYLFNDDNRIKTVRQRHIGSIVDNEWKVLSSFNVITKNGKKAPNYLLKNINTGEEISISCRALIDIKNGLTSMQNLKQSREIGVASYLGKKRAAKRKRIKHITESL